MLKLISAGALLVSVLASSFASAAALDDYYLAKFGKQTNVAKVLETVVLQPATVERCRTDLYRRLKRDYAVLEPATQKALAKYVGRPVLSGEALYSTAHFTIHYATTGTDAPSLTDTNPADGIPDWVETVGSVFEYVYATEISAMGYRPPPVKSTYDVYLLDLSAQGVYGYTTDNGAPTAPNLSVGSYIEIDKAFTDSQYTVHGIYTPLQMLQVTAAHEFHHAIQFGYNYYFDIWYGEASSTWMENEVYEGVNQCYSYLSSYLSSTPPIALDGPLDSGSEYGRWIFNRYLAEQHQTSDVVRSIWEKVGTLSPSSSPKTSSGDLQMPPIIDSVLRNSYGSSIADDFLGLAKRVYARNWSTHTADISMIPGANIAATYSSYPVASNVATMSHYTFTYFKFVPSTTTTDLNLTVAKTSGIHVAVLKKSGSTVSEVTANTDGTSYSVSGFGSLDPASNELVLVAANTTSVDNHQLSYSTDGSTSTITEPVVKKSSGGGGGGGGCFIATAAYGSYLHPKVAELRAFRDRYLMTNAPGRLFVSLYYRLSPPIANVIAQHEWMKALVRVALLPLIFAVEHPMAALTLLILVLAVGVRAGVPLLKGRAQEAASA